MFPPLQEFFLGRRHIFESFLVCLLDLSRRLHHEAQCGAEDMLTSVPHWNSTQQKKINNIIWYPEYCVTCLLPHTLQMFYGDFASTEQNFWNRAPCNILCDNATGCGYPCHKLCALDITYCLAPSASFPVFYVYRVHMWDLVNDFVLVLHVPLKLVPQQTVTSSIIQTVCFI